MRKFIFLIGILFLSFVLAGNSANDYSGESSSGDNIITAEGDVVSSEDVDVIDVGGNLKEREKVIRKTKIKLDDEGVEKKLKVVKDKLTLRKVEKGNLKNKLFEFNKVRKQKFFEKYKEKGFKARVVVKEKLLQRNKLLKNIKSNFIEARKDFIDSRKELMEARQARLNCEENCDEKIQEYRNKFKESMLFRVDIILKHLEKLKLRIEMSESLTEEEVNNLLDVINNKINEMEELKVRLQDAETKEEIIEISKEIRDNWKKFKYNSKIFAAKVVNANLGNIILRSKLIEAKLSRVLERMESDGKDISEVEILIDELHEYLANAEESYKLAHEKLDELRENDEKVSGVKDYIKESRDYLKKAKETLKEIIAKIKELNAADKLVEANEEISDAEEVAE
jgi:hypothetical protein